MTKKAFSLAIMAGLFLAMLYLHFEGQHSHFAGAVERSAAAVERMEAAKQRLAALPH